MMLILMMTAAALQVDAKTMSADDWHKMSITHIGSADVTGPVYLRVQGGDLDGDGVADTAVLRLVCSNGIVSESAYSVTSPRDLATGQASGKRMHKPLTIVKEWGPASPQLAAMKPTYDLNQLKTARAAAGDGWTSITLGATDGLCAAATADRSRSNIRNN